MNGRIYSIESAGMVDGPGIRTVVFLQGCGLKCSFCHNPDSQRASGGTEISSSELMEKIKRFKPYFERSGGGVTFSGGEPLLQRDFLLEMLILCKNEGIHTCLDTSGAGVGGYEEILKYTDLVLYDVKALTKESYQKICMADISKTEEFQKHLSGTETIVRQVVIPGINDNDDYMIKLKAYIKEKLPRVKKVELLPYHLLGEHKYKAMNIKPPLEGVPAMDREACEKLWEKHFKNI